MKTVPERVGWGRIIAMLGGGAGLYLAAAISGQSIERISQSGTEVQALLVVLFLFLASWWAGGWITRKIRAYGWGAVFFASLPCGVICILAGASGISIGNIITEGPSTRYPVGPFIESFVLTPLGYVLFFGFIPAIVISLICAVLIKLSFRWERPAGERGAKRSRSTSARLGIPP